MVSTLILSPSKTTTGSLLAAAASAAGLTVTHLATPDELTDASSAHVYGGPRWASVFASALDLALLEPMDSWLPALPRPFTQRSVNLTTAGAVASRPGTFFAKPPREKAFDPSVYSSSSFAEVARAVGLEDHEPVLVADPVEFGREYRLLVLEGRVHTGSRYLSWGSLDPLPLDQDPHAAEILAFAVELLEDQADAFPAAFTLDVGYARNERTGEEGWAVVEANMAWFSNIYACEPAKALDVVLRAAGPARLYSPAELNFSRVSEPRP